MALELLQELESGVSGNYWRIGSVVVACTDDPVVTIYMDLYLNRDARISGKSSLKTQPVNMMLYQIDSTYDYDFRACIYNSIKQLPYWENARDVFEFSEKYDNSPIANYVDVECDYNSTKNITFNAVDINNLPLQYIIVDQPANGTITQVNGLFKYKPNTGWQGTDLATYRVSNGTNTSNLAKIYLTVPMVVPTVQDISVQSDYNGSSVVNFSATDPNDLTLNFVITQQPSNGTISENNGTFIYIPNQNWSGNDVAKYKANNGQYDSAEATISLVVVSDVPVANDMSFEGLFNSSKIITLSGSDPNNLPLSFSITQQPSNGQISDNNGVFTYIPDTDWVGNDVAKFKANNGTYESADGTITLSVSYPIPNVDEQSFTLNQNTVLQFNLTGSDPANLPLTFSVISNPQNGLLVSENDGSYKYTPNQDFLGSDFIVVRANNGFEDSADTTIYFEVIENV